MCEENADRSRSHALPRALLAKQAEALGVEICTRDASWSSYEAVFIEALKDFRARGFSTAIFGDIDLQPHRDWEEKVCAAAQIEPVLPLWDRARVELAHEVIDLGFRAVVVCVDSRHLPDEFCGRNYDASFLADLPAGVDACGENGEFHTFVYDGPNFQRRVEFKLESLEPYVAPKEFGGTRYCFASLK
jgi:uncharacterized protein (TIGR00290 family)